MRSYRFIDGDIDGLKGVWRAVLKPLAWDAAGDPTAWKTLALVNCTDCSQQSGCGGTGRPEIKDGQTKLECLTCKTIEDVTLESWADAEALHAGRAQQDVKREKKSRALAELDQQIRKEAAEKFRTEAAKIEAEE